MRWASKFFGFLFREPSLRPEIVAVRRRLLDVLLVALVVVGGISILIGVVLTLLARQYHYAQVYLFLAVMLVLGGLASRKRAYHIKGSLIVVVGMAMGVMTLFRIGLSGVGIEILTTFTVLATVLFGLRRGLLCLAIGVVAVISAAVAYVLGFVETPVETLLTSHSAIAWTNATILFALFTFVLVLSPQLLLRRLHVALETQERRADDLDRTNQELNSEMDRRLCAEQAQSESEGRFKELAELIPEAIIETRADGSLSFANVAACDAFGYSLPELLAGCSFIDLLSEDEITAAEQHMAQVMAGDSVGLREYQGRCKDGSTVPLLVRLARMQTVERDGGMRGLILDISEKKRLEQQLHQAQRMEALGTLAGGIAHDFNNLLTAIQGRATLLRRVMDAGSPGEKHLQQIEGCVDSAAGLTGRLLGLGRGGKYELLPTDINQLVRKSIELFGRTRKGITIRLDLAPEIWSVRVDRQQIEQVLLNLLVNADHAMSSSGAVMIQFKNVSLPAERAQALGVQPGDYVRTSVTDTGTGMSQETLSRIFDPFFTTKEVGLGTGLGLASAYGIAKNHGGTVEAQSELGHGATFHVLLPAEPGQVHAEPPAATEKLLGGSETILVVDDEIPVLTTTQKLLQQLGYDVITASSGEEALDLLSATAEPIALVVLDMVMPTLSGPEVYQRIRSSGQRVKVLLSGGYSIDGEARQLLDEGCSGFLSKPYSLKSLTRKVRQVLDAPRDDQTYAEGSSSPS